MWYLLPDEDERMIAEAAREFLSEQLPLERLRPHAVPADPAAAYRGMAELGWFGIGLPEDAGGTGLGLAAEMLVQRECARYLASPSVLATVLAGHVAHHAGHADAAQNFANGKYSAALSIDAAPDAPGEERSVLAFDWHRSHPLLYWNAQGMGLFYAPDMATRHAQECIDDSVTMHAGRLALAGARLWVPAGTAPLSLRADVLLAAALGGLASHACDLAVGYAKLRDQFGKPIGAFQAVKHRCADMAVRQRLAWYQTCLAALKLEAGAADAPLQVASARLLAAEAAQENGRACIQIHGGIGFQAECDAHWFVKRAFVYDQAGGAMAEQARRIIAEPMPQ